MILIEVFFRNRSNAIVLSGKPIIDSYGTLLGYDELIEANDCGSRNEVTYFGKRTRRVY